MFELIFDENAIEFLQKSPQIIKERIYSKIIQTKENPLHFFIKLNGRKEFKLRVGDYRVIADLDFRENKIIILLIGHRKNIYQELK
jgi:mRNA interferase RelE/StbE